MQSLSQEQLREVLERAEQIQQKRNTSVEVASDLDTVLAAAEEAGLSREAVEQALQERLGLLGAPPKTGDLVFAKGNEGRFYAAEIVEQRGSSIHVEFLSGTKHTVPFEDLRPLTLLPGERLVCPWPDWGFWNSTIISYNPKSRKLRMSDNWGSQATFDLADVYLNPPKDSSASRGGVWSRVQWAAVVASGLLGGAVGSVLTWLLTR